MQPIISGREGDRIDHRYYELVEDTIQPERQPIKVNWLAITDAGRQALAG
jgi:hypothetical protein